MASYSVLSENGRDVPTLMDYPTSTPIISKADVLSSVIMWDAYVRGGMINDSQAALIKAYDKKSETVRKDLVEKDGAAYAALFTTLAQKMNTTETLQYVLTLILDFINVNPRRVELFYGLAEQQAGYPWAPFLSLATERRGDKERDLYCTRAAAIILSLLLSKGSQVPAEHVDFLLRWIVDQLRKPTSQDCLIAASALQTLFFNQDYRLMFCKMNGVPLLVSVLKAQTGNVHLLYDTVYAVWLLSYNPTLGSYLQNTGIITALVNIIKSASSREKEKVTRLSLAALRNMLDKEGNNEEMIDAGLPRMLNLLGNKKWADEDILEDMKVLNEILAKNIVVLSSFDAYKKEINTGKLEWTPVHKSEKFWRENAHRFEESEYQTLVKLQKILQTSADPITLAVAAYDVGEFARIHPRGRQIVQQIGIKTEIMKLISHPDAQVQKQALFSIQKVMVHNWEYLSGK